VTHRQKFSTRPLKSRARGDWTFGAISSLLNLTWMICGGGAITLP
jgi:hypothetical protein